MKTVCLICGDFKNHHARGLCAQCYWKMKYIGDLDLFEVINYGSLELAKTMDEIERKYRWSEVDFSEPVKRFLFS